jgi:hypothetical protein
MTPNGAWGERGSAGRRSLADGADRRPAPVAWRRVTSGVAMSSRGIRDLRP